MSNKKKSQYIRPTSRNKFNPLIGNFFEGQLEIVKSGMGFVIVPNMEKDIFVRPEDMNSALNGDTVKVQVLKVNTSDRPEGIITSITNRNQDEFIGSLQVSDNFAFFIPENQQIRFDVYIPKKSLLGAQNGEKVAVKITDWGNKKKKPSGIVLERFTNERENDIAMKSIILDAGFNLRFPQEVIDEADALPVTLDEKEIAKRRDFRNVFTATIDPIDAKDFDDAISFQTLDNGNFEIGVHIADVSYYVRPNTALDDEAYDRATSVYLPDRVVPMLPENISNVLCSLRPNEDKFTFSAVFEITPKGKIVDEWIGRTVIHSDRRYTYEEAQVIIETGEGENAEVILALDKIAKIFRKQRFDNGAINFNSQEIRFKLDENGIPIGIVIKESKDAHKLIEEFMLLANRTVATYVSNIKINGEEVPFPYRNHDQPVEEKLANFAQFAAKFGYKLELHNPEKIADSFNQLLNDINGKPEQNILEQLGIRTMAKANYDVTNIGHYGLGFEYYCHFTSPIRRYPDVLVHRVVQDCLDQQAKLDEEMAVKCDHCSEKERKAMEAERAANKYKQVEFMNKYVGEVFPGVVSGVSAMGFWVETIEHKCEGFISITELLDYDQFEFIENEYALIGFTTGKRFRIGQEVTIQVLNTDLVKRQIDFGYVPSEEFMLQVENNPNYRKPAKAASFKKEFAPKPTTKKATVKETPKAEKVKEKVLKNTTPKIEFVEIIPEVKEVEKPVKIKEPKKKKPAEKIKHKESDLNLDHIASETKEVKKVSKEKAPKTKAPKEEKKVKAEKEKTKETAKKKTKRNDSNRNSSKKNPAKD